MSKPTPPRGIEDVLRLRTWAEPKRGQLASVGGLRRFPTWSSLVLGSVADMPASRGGKLRRKGRSLARRARRQATAAWRLLYRLLVMVSRNS